MVRDPVASRARQAPDRARRAPHVRGHVARSTLRLGRDVALGPGGHQPVGRPPQTRLDPPMDRVSRARLAPPRPQVPRPRAPPPRLGHRRERLPARSLRLIAPTGGEQRQRRMVRAWAPRGVGPHHGAPPEGLAPDRTSASIPARHPTAPQRPPHDRGVGVQGRAAPGWHGQAEGPGEHALREDLAPLAAPGIDGDLGPPSAQRGCPAQGHQGRARATRPAAVGEGAPGLGVAALPPLGHQASVGRRLVARLGAWQRLPGVGHDRRADVPVPRGRCTHTGAPSGGRGRVARPRCSHASSALSPPSGVSCAPHPPHVPLSAGGLPETPHRLCVLWAAQKRRGLWPCSPCP